LPRPAIATSWLAASALAIAANAASTALLIGHALSVVQARPALLAFNRELIGDRVIDEGGDLWHRRIEEIDALACALCAHRFAVGHASVVDGVVLPGTGTGELAGLRGRTTIEHDESGAVLHLDYELP